MRALGHERFAVLGMSVGGAYAVACAARHPDRVAALGLVAIQPPGDRTEEVDLLAADPRRRVDSSSPPGRDA